MPGYKRAELLLLKGSYRQRIQKFVQKEWPELAAFHNRHDNWNQCFIKCRFTLLRRIQVFELVEDYLDCFLEISSDRGRLLLLFIVTAKF